MKKILSSIAAATITLLGNAVEIPFAELRRDQYPLDMSEQLWIEAWSEPNQFFPRYFKPSDTVQIVLKNNANTDAFITPEQIKLNGSAMSEVLTRPNFAGDVIWLQAVPEILKPGEYGMLMLRLRNAVTKPIQVAVNNATVTLTTANRKKVTIQYAALTNGKLLIYALGDQIESAELNDTKLNVKIYNSNCQNGNPALLVADLPKNFHPGDRPILKVHSKAGASVEPLLLKEAFFPIGIIGGNTKLYKKSGFNFLYNLHGGKIQQQLPGFRRLSPVNNAECLKAIAASRPEYVLGNHDEPDAREPQGLPYMERCGINAMQLVMPLTTLQRKYAPRNATALMIDRTYAPLNWYTYAPLVDMPFNDCYVPTHFHGFDSEVLHKTAQVYLSAAAPRPAQMMIWATANTNHSPRGTAPIENEVQTYYTLGSGLKGLHYFIDWSSYPNVSEGGYFLGASKLPALWREITRGNAVLNRLGKLPAIASRWKGTQSSNDKAVWHSMLLAGPDTLILVAVNRQIKADALDKSRSVFTTPARNIQINATLPAWFDKDKITIQEVNAANVANIKLTRKKNTVTFQIPELIGGKCFVITRTPVDLSGNAETLAEISKILAIPPFQPGPILTSPEQLKVDDDWKEKTKFTLKSLHNASLHQTGKGIALLPGADPIEAQAVFSGTIKSDIPLTIIARGLTHSLGYRAAIELREKENSRNLDSSRKPLWHTGASPKEFLSIDLIPVKGIIYFEIALRDPLLVKPDGYSAEVTSITIQPKKD